MPGRLLAAILALALSAATPASGTETPIADVRLNGGFGVSARRDAVAGPALAGLATARYAVIQGGLLAALGGEFFGESYQLYAGTAGLAWRPGRFRFDALGVAGVMVRSYDPCTLFCDGPTIDAATWTSPWLGGRVGAAYNFGSRSRSARFELGVAGLYGVSTSGGRDTGVYYDTAWFTGERYLEHEDHDFQATWLVGGLITAGVTFNLGRGAEKPSDEDGGPAYDWR